MKTIVSRSRMPAEVDPSEGRLTETTAKGDVSAKSIASRYCAHNPPVPLPPVTATEYIPLAPAGTV